MTLEKLARDLLKFFGKKYERTTGQRFYQKDDKIIIELYTLTGTIKLTLEKGAE